MLSCFHIVCYKKFHPAQICIRNQMHCAAENRCLSRFTKTVLCCGMCFRWLSALVSQLLSSVSSRSSRSSLTSASHRLTRWWPVVLQVNRHVLKHFLCSLFLYHVRFHCQLSCVFNEGIWSFMSAPFLLCHAMHSTACGMAWCLSVCLSARHDCVMYGNN